MHFLTMHPTRSCLIPQTFVFCVFCPVCSRLHKTSPTTSTPRRRQWQEDFGKMSAYFFSESLDDKMETSLFVVCDGYEATRVKGDTHTTCFLYGSTNQIPPKSQLQWEEEVKKALFLRQRLAYKRSLRPKHWPFLINQCRREKNLCKTHSFSLKYEATASSR